MTRLQGKGTPTWVKVLSGLLLLLALAALVVVLDNIGVNVTGLVAGLVYGRRFLAHPRERRVRLATPACTRGRADGRIRREPQDGVGQPQGTLGILLQCVADGV